MSPKTGGPVLPTLVPMLTPPSDHPSVPFIDGHLHLGLAVGPDGRCVTEEELLTWDRPFERLCDRAVLDLRGRTAHKDIEKVQDVPGLYRFESEDGLAAARMLCMDALLTSWPLEGVIVACPDPNRLVLVPMEGVASVSAIRATLRLLSEWRAERDPLSDQLFWCDRDRNWHHLPVHHRPHGGADLMPVRGLSEALDRAIAVGIGVPGEA